VASYQTQQHVHTQTRTNSQSPQKVTKSDTPSNFIEIGRPIGIRSELDYNNILRNRILSKMSIIDLVPVDAGIDFIKAGEAAMKGNAKGAVSNFVPKVMHSKAMEDFGKLCTTYGLPNAAGVRLYLVDESTVVNEIRNEFSDNLFQSVANRLSEWGQQLYQAGKSLSTRYDESIDTLVNSLKNAPGANTSIGQKAIQATKALTSMAIKGTRISLPKIWSDSSYQTQASCVVKLVSPYGSPKAILNYVAKPLLALLLLSSAVSTDGVSYGYPRLITIYAYGLDKILMGAVDSISIRRGGADTSFNKYRQPLSVDVSITFTTIIHGYAALKEKTDGEHDVLNKFTEFVQDPSQLTESKLPLLSTPGKLIDSLRPVNLVNYESQTNRGFISLQQPVPQQQEAETETPSIDRQSDTTTSASSAVRNDISNSNNSGAITSDPTELSVA